MIKQVEVGQQKLWLKEYLQVSGVSSSIPIISYMATIHDLTKDVF